MKSFLNKLGENLLYAKSLNLHQPYIMLSVGSVGVHQTSSTCHTFNVLTALAAATFHVAEFYED